MKTTSEKQGTFEKVGACLCRYTPTGTYDARLQVKCKEVRRSLRTDDRATAKRKLGDLQRGLERSGAGADRLTLGQLCDRCLSTARNQSGKTVKRKTAIAATIKRAWKGGAEGRLEETGGSRDS